MDGERRIERGSGRPLGGGYRTSAGKRCVSVTTVLGILDKPGLRKWYYECGLAGVDPTTARDDAGDVGTATHKAIEMHVHGHDGRAVLAGIELPDDGREKALRAFDRFIAWEAETKPTYLATEIALVSDTHALGGTLDVLCVIDGKRTILDVKTGKGPYLEMLLQQAAYRELLREARGEDVDQVALAFIGDVVVRKPFHAYDATRLDAAWRLFLAALAAYREQRAVEALLGGR